MYCINCILIYEITKCMNTVLLLFPASLPFTSGDPFLKCVRYDKGSEENLMNALNDNIVRNFNFDMT